MHQIKSGLPARRNFLFRILAIALVSAPVLFMNIRDSHDWGDDFAQYLLQAKNICEGKPQTSTGYFVNEDFAELGPATYPVGFPLLLAPVYGIWGPDIKVFNLYLSFFLFLSAFPLFALFRKKYGRLISFFLLVIYLYHPWVIGFKSEINSEIPFTFFFFTALLLAGREDKSLPAKYLLAGACAGIAMSIRTIGVVIPLWMAASTVWNTFFREKGTRFYPAAFAPLGSVITAILIFFLLNAVFFQTLGGSMEGYLRIFSLRYFAGTILHNLSYYTDVFSAFWMLHGPGSPYRFISVFFQAFVILMWLAGVIRQSKKGFGYLDTIPLLYLLVLLVYPYRASGFRFLFPLLPFFLWYIVSGLETVPGYLSHKSRTIIFSVLVFALYLFPLIRTEKNTTIIPEGPQYPPSIEAFSFIRNYTGEEDRIVFFKPRALALYTGRTSMAIRPGSSGEAMERQMEKFGADFVLVHKELPDDALKNYSETRRMERIWENEKFRLYRRRQAVL